MTIRPVIRRTVPDNLPGSENPRKVLVLHADGRVRLVVLQHHIVTRLILLNQIVLQQQSILFRIDHNIADVGNLADEHPGLPRFMLLAEIGIDPFL